MRTFIVDITVAGMLDPVEHYTKVFDNINDAREYIEEAEREWLNDEFQTMRNYLGYNEDNLNDWIQNSLCDDIDNYDYIYKHYVYDGGQEKIFEMSEQTVEEFSTYIVIEDYRFMNDIFETDRVIHMITTNFQKALARALELKQERRIEFDHYEEYEDLDMTGMYYQYNIANEYDQVNINIERHEVV